MTTNCTFFDAATGGITLTATLSDETLTHYIESGANALLDVLGDPSTQHVVQDASGNWGLVDFTADELAARAANALPARRAAMWERIKEKRDSTKRGGVKVAVNGADYWFHSDDPSRIQQLGLVMMGANVPAVQWKTMSGAFVTMTQALANSIFNAVATLDQSAFSNAESHRTAMEAAADPDTYDYSTGWPQVYADTLQP